MFKTSQTMIKSSNCRMSRKIVSQMNVDIPNYFKTKSPNKKNKKQTESPTDAILTLGKIVEQFDILKEQLPLKTKNKNHFMSRIMMTRNQGPKLQDYT